ncbi:MAG TPA: cytochrome C, partial [Candidatus Binatia bacterium]
MPMTLPRRSSGDVALDAQYQYITDAHIFSATTTWIHEFRKFNNVGLADRQHDWLDTVRLTGSYFFKRKIGGTVQLFSTTGSQ